MKSSGRQPEPKKKGVVKMGSSVNETVRTLAVALGVSESDIQVRRPEWVAMMRNGVMVSHNIRRWRATTVLGADHLGIIFEDESEENAYKETLHLGELYLLPARYLKRLNSIDSGARKGPAKYAYKIQDPTGGANHRDFMTPESFVKWLEEDREREAQYYAVRDEIFEKYNEIIFEVADFHSANARAAYRRLAAEAVRSEKAARVLGGMSEGAFIQRYVDVVLNAIPSAVEIRESFQWNRVIEYLPLPALLASEQADAEIEFDRVQAERAKSEAEIRMHQEVLNSYKARMDEMVIDHLRTMVGQLNSVLYRAAADVLASVDAKNTMHPRSVVQLRGAIERIKAMNSFGYNDIERMVAQAEAVLDNQERTSEEAKRKLEDIVLVTRSTLMGLGEYTRGGRAVDVTEIPTEDSIRTARANLGLADIPEMPAGERRERRRA